MSFSFGGTPQPAFGTPQKSTGFGQQLSFGTPATSAPTGFGGFGSTFGAQTQAPTFGSTFGAPNASATPAPTFGNTFAQPTASVAPTFGTSFGAPTSAPAPAFGSTFGATTTTAPNLFASTTTKPNLFGGSTTTPGLFSTPASTSAGLFGATTTTQATGLFGSTTTPSLFGGSNVATTAAPLFGSTFGAGAATTSAPSLFGSTAPGGGLGTNLFGQATTQSSLFGGFGANTATTASGFGGFGGFGATGTTSSNLFGGAFGSKPIASVMAPPGIAQQAPVQETLLQKTLTSFYSINVFADERDDILKKWNMLQACWGTGKGYYSPSQPPVEYDHSNPFYRFKAVGYVMIPKNDNSEGLVKMWINKKESELSNQKEALVNGINGILGNKQNLSVSVELIKGITETQTEIMITVSEKGLTGTSRKIPASDLAAFLNQPLQKQQLTSVGVTNIAPYLTPSKAQLEEYLRNPPNGVDKQMWRAAQADNPDPNNFIPAPINGFGDLKKRMLCLKYDSGLHRAFLVKVNDIIVELKKRQAASVAQITEQKQKFLELQHRLLRVLVKQEVTRKIGIALQPEEERLRERFEMMNNVVNLPSQFKGQLKELVATVRIMGTQTQPKEHYKMDPQVQDDVKQFLKMEQNGIAHLVSIINEDLRALKVINEGMSEILSRK